MDTASQRKVSYGCTMLLGTEKRGELQCDADGYYTVVLGAYGAYNSAGMFYDLASARRFFQPGSALIRQIEKGVLRGEWKHPAKAPGMDQAAYIGRLREIDDNRTSHHIRRVTLDGTQKDDQGRTIFTVVGEIRPSGPYGPYLKDALDNPHENVYFSVRSLTMDDVIRGVKYTKEIITWDAVNEGGIYNANKYMSPALENFHEEVISPTVLYQLADHQASQKDLGIEDNGPDYRGLITELGWELDNPARQPIYNRW